MTAKISERVLRSSSSSESYQRGADLYHSAAIFDTYRQGDTLYGKCVGSDEPFYRLEVQLGEGGIVQAFCDCPYDWGGYCKHIIALLLTYINVAEVFVERKSIEEQLAQLDKSTLVNLLAKLADTHADVHDWLQDMFEKESDNTQEVPIQNNRNEVSKPDDTKKIQNILERLQDYNQTESYWMMGDLVDELESIFHDACDILAAGDARRALDILTTLLSQAGETSVEDLDDAASLLDFLLNEMALPTVEAILRASLSVDERRSLYHELNPVITALFENGIQDPTVILAALNSGWFDDDLDEPEDYLYDKIMLNQARLNMLESQGRMEEYLEFCLESGMHRHYALKQIELGEFETAREAALNHLTDAGEALDVASALQEAGRLPDALQLARKGLELNGNKYHLGIWLGPIEEAEGDSEQAVQAYRAAFDYAPSLELYSALKRVSHGKWHDLRPVLLKSLTESQRLDVLVDAYLFDEDWEQATAIADVADEWNYTLVEKVAKAVLPVRPDWVIEAGRKQAEVLIGRTQKKYYKAAVRWLARVKQAYLAADRHTDWEAYLDELKSTYARRPSLQEELEKLS